MRLRENVDIYLKQYGGYLVSENVRNGVDLKVKYIHEFGNGGSGYVAELKAPATDLPTDEKTYVVLSAAYCQILWLMLYYALLCSDKERIAEGIKEIDPEGTYDLCRIISEGSLSATPGIKADERQMLDYMSNVLTLSDDEVKLRVQKFVRRLKDGHLSYQEVVELHSLFPMNDAYGLKVSGAYSFGTVFTLFHEHGHFSNESSLSKAEIRDNAVDLEYSADITAMINAIESTDKHSRELKSFCFGAIAAILCIRWIGSDIPDDGIHPDELSRLDRIVGEVRKSGSLSKEEMDKLTVAVERWKALFASL